MSKHRTQKSDDQNFSLRRHFGFTKTIFSPFHFPVLIDEREIILKISGHNHNVLCSDPDSNFTMEDADEICKLLGMESAVEYSQIEIELENGTQWVNKLGFWSANHSNSHSGGHSGVHSEHLNESKAKKDLNELINLYRHPNHLTIVKPFVCKDSLAQTVTCKKFVCSPIHRNHTTTSQIGTPREIESMVRLRANLTDPNNNSTRLVECLAQIISPMYLLSSFSCLNSLKSVKINKIALSLSHTQTLENRISRIILHPRSIYRSVFVRNFDLALAQLEQPILFDNLDADAICLPNKDIDIDITCFLTNFQDSEAIPFLVVDRERCNEFAHYNRTVLKDNLCAIKQKDHEDDRPTLSADDHSGRLERTSRSTASQTSFLSGSPLICLNSDSKWFLAGFLNYHDDRNNLEHPTVFSNVHRMLDFIARVTGMS